MADDDIHAELRAIREELQKLNNAIGALSTATHLPASCELRGQVYNLTVAEAKRTGALVVIGVLISLVSGSAVAFLSRILRGP